MKSKHEIRRKSAKIRHIEISRCQYGFNCEIEFSFYSGHQFTEQHAFVSSLKKYALIAFSIAFLKAIFYPYLMRKKNQFGIK